MFVYGQIHGFMAEGVFSFHHVVEEWAEEE